MSNVKLDNILDEQTGRIRISKSKLNMYLRCPKQFEYRYIQGLKVPPSGAMALGTSVHTGIATNLTQKIESGADLSPSDVADATATSFDRAEMELEPGEEKGQLKDRAVACAIAHTEYVAPTIQPAKVESQFYVYQRDKDYDLYGFKDCVTKDGFVIDHKTSSRKPSGNQAERAPELVLYAISERDEGNHVQGAAFDYLVISETKKSGLQVSADRHVAAVTEADEAFVKTQIDAVVRGIKAGVFPPITAQQGNFMCTETKCGFWQMCMGKRK